MLKDKQIHEFVSSKKLCKQYKTKESDYIMVFKQANWVEISPTETSYFQKLWSKNVKKLNLNYYELKDKDADIIKEALQDADFELKLTYNSQNTLEKDELLNVTKFLSETPVNEVTLELPIEILKSQLLLLKHAFKGMKSLTKWILIDSKSIIC